jgi:hypothetical protein
MPNWHRVETRLSKITLMNVCVVVLWSVFTKVLYLLSGNLFQTAHDSATRNSVLSTFSAFPFYWGNFCVYLMLCPPFCFAYMFFSFWNLNITSVLTLCKQNLFVKSKNNIVKFLVSCYLLYLKHCIIADVWYRRKQCYIEIQMRLSGGYLQMYMYVDCSGWVLNAVKCSSGVWMVFLHQ